MTESENHEEASVSIRPIHGTARRIRLRSVLPAEKTARECFWVRTWAETVDWGEFDIESVRPYEDDSHGNHDSVIEFGSGVSLGVQVTELTSELERKRSAMRRRFIHKLLKTLATRQISAPRKIAVMLHVAPESTSDSVPRLNTEKVASNIERAIRSQDFARQTVDGHHITFKEIDDTDDFYTPNYGNVSIDLAWDQVPRTLRTYYESIDAILEKKMDSQSPILLIWSLEFWRDKPFWGIDLIDYMIKVFADIPACLVIFIESIDGEIRPREGSFWTNLCSTTIKPPSIQPKIELDSLMIAGYLRC